VTDFSADSIVIRTVPEQDVTPELDKAIRNMLVECFPKDAEHFCRQRWWHSPHQWTTVAFDGSAPVGGICVVERGVSVGGELHQTAGIGNVCTLPGWRKQGIVDRMMVHTLDEAASRGMMLSILFCKPELEKVYSRMGFATVRGIVSIRDANGKTVPKDPKDLTMGQRLDGGSFPTGDIDILGRDW